MSTQILIKRSTTTGAIPTTADIAVGELAVNTTDKRIFTNNSGTIVELGTTPTTQAVTGNASVGGTFDVVGAVTVGNLTADGTVDLTSATVTIPAPTADTHPATKKYVDDEVNAILDGAPAALDTLNEIAAAINDDANVFTTLTNSIATKLPLAGGTMTGAIDMGANGITTSVDPATDNTLTRKSYVDGLYQSTVDAEVSAAAALASEQAAATSASNAATSASASATSATASASSATNAASSATAAASSATSSANSATASATSATQSAASATAAQALVDSIEVYYLGAEASAPTTDDNGDPLQAGAWYFNTTDDNTYIYNGSSWQTVSPDLVSDTTPQLGGNLDTNGNDITFGDNDKAVFGAGSDLEIFHDGSNSKIRDTGTGYLIIGQSNTGVSIQDGGGNALLQTDADKATLYYNGSPKLAPSSTGVDVTGTVTADGLTVDTGDVIELSGGSGEYIDTTTGIIRHNSRGSVQLYTDTNNNDASTAVEFQIFSGGIAGATTDKKLTVTRGGDISFYEDTGTTAKFFWDASAESLGIGTDSPSATLEISDGEPEVRLTDTSDSSYSRLRYNGAALLIEVDDGNTVADSNFRIQVDGAEAMRIDSSGNVGIGTDSPSAKLHIVGASENIIIGNTDETQSGLVFQDHGADASQTASVKYDSGSNGLVFCNNTSTTERMRIDSSGNLLVGTTSTATYNFTSGTGTLLSGGLLSVASTSDNAMALNRTGSDGSIAQFRKDGSVVGSIGSGYGVIDIKGGSAGLLMGNSAVLPVNGSGTLTTDSYDIGAGSFRFKDFHLAGTVLNGTSTPYGKFTAYGDDRYYANFASKSASSSTSTHYVLSVLNAGSTTIGTITHNNSSTSYNTSSDYRLKEDWQPVANASDRVAQLKPVNFAWKESGDRVDGFLAHELAEVIPEAVTGEKDAMRTEQYEVSPAVLDDEGNVVTEAVMGEREVPDYQGIDQSKLIPLLTAALQEALTEIDNLKQRVNALETN